MSARGASEGQSFCINQTANVTVPQPIHVQGNSEMRNSRPVLVTPLRTINGTAVVPTSTVQVSKPTQPHSVIEKLILKATYKEGKECKLFVLRNIDCVKVKCCEDLKSIIKTQLYDDIVSDDFDVGVESGGKIISMRTQADLLELWSNVQQGKNCQIWCDGLRQGDNSVTKRAKRKSPDTSRSSVASKKKNSSQEERDEKVASYNSQLKQRHGGKFTPMQNRIWAEMLSSGIHESLDQPPTCSMFKRAGNGDCRQKPESVTFSEAITSAAVAISSALAPNSSVPVSQTKTSPAKQIESRSKCYKQLNELSNLKANGVITEDEYIVEKNAVMAILRQLK